jgi:transcription elongation GreA/GreB family factor
MSRAFVKEPEGEQAETDLPDRPQSPGPNYVTPRGLLQLQTRLRELLEQRDRLTAQPDELSAKQRVKELERDIRYYEGRAQSAIVVDAKQQSQDDIRFGAVVTVLDQGGNRHEFTLVGEDESCAPQGLISWTSPLAKALLGRQAGDVTYWERPAGIMEIEIESFRYRED